MRSTVDAGAEGFAEQSQLRAAETEARLRRVADRAVVLHQEVAVVGFDDLGHVSLGGALGRKGGDPGAQRRAGIVEHAPVHPELLVGPGVDDAGETVVAQRVADRVDQLHGELTVAIGERPAADVGERPASGGPARPLRGRWRWRRRCRRLRAPRGAGGPPLR